MMQALQKIKTSRFNKAAEGLQGAPAANHRMAQTSHPTNTTRDRYTYLSSSRPHSLQELELDQARSVRCC